jgi:hypothetical protein
MHGTGVFGARTGWRGADRGFLIDELSRILAELLQAGLATEMVGLPAMFQGANRVRRSDGHPTDGVENLY